VKTAAKLMVNLASRSRMRNRKASAGIFEAGGEVARHLGDPRAVGTGGDAEHVHDAARDPDHEEHVVAPEEDGVDVEEVHRHDAFRLGA